MASFLTLILPCFIYFETYPTNQTDPLGTVTITPDETVTGPTEKPL